MSDDTFGDRTASSHPCMASLQASLSEDPKSAAQTVCQVSVARTEPQIDQQRYQDLFLFAPDACVVTDLQGTIQEANHRAVSLFEVQPVSVSGQLLSEYVAHNDLPRFLAQLEGVLEASVGEHAECTMRMQSRGGRVFPAALAISALRDSQGMPSVLCWFVREIAGHHYAETSLLRAERMSLTARLVALLAEQLHNPLQVVVGCLGLAQETLAGRGEASSYLRMAANELDRISAIANRLRELYQQPTFRERGPADLNALMKRVLGFVVKQLEERHIETVFHAADYLPMFVVVHEQIEQVFLNLLLNAVDAMPSGGQLDIRMGYQYQPAGVAISVADTGPGIAPDALNLIFTPFYTTKPEGLGLGLYITRSIVEAHGGHVEVDSQVGKGTTFRVWLPG